MSWLQEMRQVDYVDMITEPGPFAILADDAAGEGHRSIRRRLEISMGKHGASTVAVVAHHDCAGNPVDKASQLGQLAEAVRRVSSWAPGVEVLGLWVDERRQVHLQAMGSEL